MRRVLTSLAVLLAVVVTAAAQQADVTALSPDNTKFTFVAYGDIRFTTRIDRVSSNRKVRRAIVARIAEEKPAFVALTGDLVLKGGNQHDWEVWEKETAPLRKAGVPLYPVLGNHDLSSDPQAVNYFAHFPQLQERRWYSLRAGNTLFLMLDSSADAEGGPQWKWLEQRLESVPAEVDFVFVALHHPPVTHSARRLVSGGHSARPAEIRLAHLLETRRAALRQPIIVLAGHVHNYERYVQNRVTYIVTGGGGATPYEVPRAANDFYREPGSTYHYMRFEVDGQRLRAEMVKLSGDQRKPQWAVKDSFELRAPATATAGHAQ